MNRARETDVYDETWTKTGVPMNLWAWPWQFWSEAAAQWMQAWTGMWAGSAPRWLQADPAAANSPLPMTWWPQVEATITPLQSAERTDAMRVSMRLRLPGDEAVAVDAVVVRGGDVPRRFPVEPEVLPGRTSDRGAGE